MSVASVTSARQRARATLRASYSRPGRSPAPRTLLERYVRAWESADVRGLVALLREDAVLRMPPKPTVVGAQRIGDFLEESIFANGPTRLIEAHANGNPAFALYIKGPADTRFVAFALLVL